MSLLQALIAAKLSGSGGGGGGGGSVTVDAALSASSENPVQNKAITNKINQMDSQLTDVKSQLDEKVSSKYETVNPKNWLDLEAIIDGEVLANGTVQSSTTRFFTDYIPVSEGDKIQAFRFNPIAAIYRRHICFYDVEKNVVSGGSDSSGAAAFTIPSGVSFVRVTFDNNILTKQPMIVLDGEAPTTYSAYFEPHEELTEDFLTPESEAAVQKIVQGTMTTAVAVSGTTPIITPANNTIYNCGELTSLTISNPPATGAYSIVFTSGATATDLSIPQTLLMPDGFTVDANTLYEINVLANRAVVGSWAVSA